MKKMTLWEIRRMGRPFGVRIYGKWGMGFIARVKDPTSIEKCYNKDFNVKGIGVGYDYNANEYTLLIIPKNG